MLANQLTVVSFGDELEENGQAALTDSTSLREIFIPPAVKAIKEEFHQCSQLTIVNLDKGTDPPPPPLPPIFTSPTALRPQTS